MQPISLKLENFGPYEDSLIDFSSFYAQSLFLITGKTGAGKTTIFDGMCFALYGKTSGGLREGKEMRANFAKIGNQTKVVFIFKQGDETYEVVREPEQLVKKQRGEGFREKPAEVSLTIYDNNQNEINQLTKQKEVGIFLGDLLQLNEQQFSQIVMLPQGEFRRFLNADSDSKEKVLRKLFNTYFYQDLAEALRQKKKTKENLLKEVRQELEILVKQINWQENFKAELEDTMYYQDVLTYYEKQSGAYSKELLEKEQILKEIHQEQEKLQFNIQEETNRLASFEELATLKEKKKSQSIIEESIKKDKEQVKLLQQIEKQAPVYQQQKNLEVESDQLLQKEKVLLDELEKIKAELKEQQVIVENLELKKADMSIAQNQIKEMTLSEPLFERQKNLLEKKIQIDKQLKELKTTETKLETDIKQIEVQMNEWQVSLNNQLVLNEEKNKLEKKQVQNESRLTEIKSYLYLAESLDKKNQEIVITQTELKSKQLVFEETSVELKQLKSNWAKAQIAKLSLDLMPGEACPVCGSLDHPAPSHGEDVSKEELAKLEEDLETSETNINLTREAIATLEKSLEFFISDSLLVKEKLKTTESMISSYFTESVNKENWLKEIEEEKLKTSEYIEENKKQIAQLEKIKIAFEQEKIRNIELVEALKGNTEQTKLVEHEFIQLTTELKNVQENLPDKWNSLAEMELVKNKLIEETTQWENSLNQRKEIIDSLVKEKLVIETTLKNINEQKETITKKLAITQQDMAKFSQTNQLDMEKMAELFEELALLPNLLQRIQNFEKDDYLLTKELARLTELLKDKVIPDVSPLLARKEELAEEESKQQQLLATISYDIKQNENLIQTIKNKEQLMKQDLDELEELAELTNVMTGDGPHKLSMERFVLQTYLKRILQRANEKLVGLTNGRYRFELKEEQASFKKKTGLEINIFDDNVGALRSVNTLSGGESFIAALSLALSLAEVIQEESGGIQIDAMFIDEGFGSLDEDALEMAIRALENIEGDGRLIGIISHVRELKERIPQQLAVKSTLDGKSYVTERLEFE